MNAAFMWVLGVVVIGGLLAPVSAHPAAVRRKQPMDITTTCPGPDCPYTLPNSAERGLAVDVFDRLNMERAAVQRDYQVNGVETALPPLALASDTAEATAQAAAEWQANHETVADYIGTDPPGFQYVAGGNAAAAGDSAGIDDSLMRSYGHALAVLSAAPTEVAIGAACSASGTVFVTENFYDPNAATAQQGQTLLDQELAQNSVYAQSGGTITTVTDTEGTGPAQDYLPQQPIVAGYGPNDSELYATGVDWTCEGPRYPAGHAPASPLPPPVVGGSASSTGTGYVLADNSGTVDTHGDVAFHGDMGGTRLNAPVVGIAATPDGGGYWEVASDGGVFSFGDARFYGSMGGTRLNAPVVGIAATPDGGGYWEVASDGGVFSFGDARFYGSMGGTRLNAPVVGIAATPDGGGYWEVASDGGVFSFGDAPFEGAD